MDGNARTGPLDTAQVNVEQCRAFSTHVPALITANQSPDPFSLTHLPQRDQLLAFLHLVGICDRINWDFLLSTLAANLWELTEGFSARRLVTITPEVFEQAFAGYRREGEDLDYGRRLHNLTAIASHAERVGIADRLLHSETITGRSGAMAILRDSPVYRDDPLLKKGNTLLHQLVRRKLIPASDDESIEPAVDYHVMRLYLRTSRVTVPDPALAASLVRRDTVSVEVITHLRATVAAAMRCTAQFASVSILTLNEAEWAFARKACERDIVSCFPAVQCPLSSICPSAGLPSVRMFTEPESRHGYY